MLREKKKYMQVGKCLLCGKLFSFCHLPEEYDPPEAFTSELADKLAKGFKNPVESPYLYHNCDDGSSGLAMIIGVMPHEIAPPCITETK